MEPRIVQEPARENTAVQELAAATADAGASGAAHARGVAPTQRLMSLDAYRGLVMFLMLAEVLRLARVAQALPESGFWRFLAAQQTHVEWAGCSLHDLIQPSFSFMVGVALPFSMASRLARGESRVRMTWHALWRALLLVLLGVFVRSLNSPQTNWIFTDTLAQIGLGYGFLFVLGFRPLRDCWIAVGAILAGYWAAFSLYPLPGDGFNYARVGVAAQWLAVHGLDGFAAHWQKNSNLAWALDSWFLNLFGPAKPFLFNRGGYATLNFIPTLATMIFGVIAGTVLRSERVPRAKTSWLAVAGLMALVAGLTLEAVGLVPIVKRIWTPSWVLYSGGWCFLLLAGFYYIVDVRGLKRWAFPLVVVGLNSIAAYLMSYLCDGFISKNLKTHLGSGVFQICGEPYGPLVQGAAVLAVMWLLLLWMHRRKIYLKI